jgi:hypothetical protein
VLSHVEVDQDLETLIKILTLLTTWLPQMEQTRTI